MVLNEELVEGVRLELEIERIVHGGLGLGHVDGFVVMTPFAAPGDLLSVVVVKRRRRYALAEPLAVLRASPWRQEPQCPWFTQCGGCNLGHLAIERQRQVKAELLASELGLPPIELKAGAALRYRNKGSFHVGEDGRLGFYRRGSNELVALDHCLLLHPGLEELLPWLERLVAALKLPVRQVIVQLGHPTTLRFVTLVLASWPGSVPETAAALIGEAEQQGVFTFLHQADKPHRLGQCVFAGTPKNLQVRLCGNDLEVGNAGFFQVNHEIAEHLARDVRAVFEAGPRERVLELYAGMGALTLTLAPVVSHVYAVELVRQATLLGESNAEKLGLCNVTFRTGKCLTIVQRLWRQRFSAETLLVDPPRRGLEPGLIDALEGFRFRRVVYVSCSLPTLKRDLTLFGKQGFRLTQLKAYDMFPQTYHFEMLAVLER
ncbi:MAG: hypothetical protein A2284_11670 [Deltaproteobacteria bacterium RIFOXYA12_FULL_61_11]|nr:MAG: hypothetical protein A2284_11670 [Deltaproteobacteria bacterium RIFOXYA12_FULL_61_11]